MSKKSRFFCDNCGTEVDRNANACSRCGRFFSSILCPKCGFSAEESLFKNGCPSCGYSAIPARDKKKPGRTSGKKTSAGKLPTWVYIFSVSAFILVFAILILRAC